MLGTGVLAEGRGSPCAWFCGERLVQRTVRRQWGVVNKCECRDRLQGHDNRGRSFPGSCSVAGRSPWQREELGQWCGGEKAHRITGDSEQLAWYPRWEQNKRPGSHASALSGLTRKLLCVQNVGTIWIQSIASL